MNLNNPDTRRAVRTIVEAVIALALVGLLYWLTSLLDGVPAGLELIARGALMILGIGAFLYGAENVTRAVKISTPFGSAEVGDDDATK